MKSKLKASELKRPIQLDAYLRGNELKFESTWGIFSPTAIDAGTVVLLKYMDIPNDATILDVGCGYGPIGVSLAKESALRDVHMTDTNFVAVDYANTNAKKNRVSNAKAYLSNGLSAVDENVQFDVIISNLPAKVGNEMYTIMFDDMYKALKPGGVVYFVTIAGLKEYMKRNLKEVFGNFDKVKQSGTYMVSKAVKPEDT
jgi:16S rRNA (guanine1207-N2)-methyltransferase